MKKILLPFAATLLCWSGLQAQTILSEDFETGNTGSTPRPITVGAGWTTIDTYKGNNKNYMWTNYYSDPESKAGPIISGAGSAHVSGTIFASDEEGGNGPREEILLSPELNLNDTYQLQVSFVVSPMNCQENSKYDFQVRVVEGDNMAGATTVFTIQDADVLRNAGVPGGLINDWLPRTAQIDLSAFKGKKAKLAFVFKMYKPIGNSLWIDDVIVKKFTPATAPKAELSLDRVAFPKVYVGEKVWSDPLSLKNVGLDGLRITSIDYPDGVSSNLDIRSLNLRRFDSVDFNLAYTASLTSAASGDVTIHTTGGDVKIAVTGQKEFIPEGLTLETFEGYFPPAGWTNNGWGPSPYSIEGDRTANCDGGYGNCALRSPRLDLTDGGQVTFTYYNQSMDEDPPEYDITLQVSYDGGLNWSTKWTSDYTRLNELITETVDLGIGTDQSYIRWVYPAVESDDEGAFPHSSFYLDRVLLPNLWGVDGVPGLASDPTPASNTEEVYPFNITLSWAPAQFADGYKVYVGTTSACNELVDGADVGKSLSLTIPEAAYETRYRWKVVGYNDKGDATGVSTWIFTTQKDATIKTFPYVEDFKDTKKGELPTGWISDDSACQYPRKWSINQYIAYVDANGDKFNPLGSSWLNAGEYNSVTTPEAILPADKAMEITFVWGDGHPADLKTDNSGFVTKHNVEPNNGTSELRFQIYAEGQWSTLSTISEQADDDGNKFWIPERIDLSNYAGQTVRFRWVHYSYSTKDNGGAVARITIEEAKGDKAAFNKKGWNAGIVNWNKAIDSGDQFTLFNHGSNAQKIARIEFGTPNFTTSLKPGDEIAAGGGLKFSVRFLALTTYNTVSDAMKVIFESGLEIEFPLSGEALGEKTRYYSFEPNDLEHNWSEDFTMIDKDKGYNYNFGTSWIGYTAANQRGAFSVESDAKTVGLYGLMQPVSGMHCLVGASPQSGGADNWLISRRVKANADSKFIFYARNMDTDGTVLPDPKHAVEVLVSTKGNTDTKDFEPVLHGHEMAYLAYGQWHYYEVDLDAYTGKDIYVALRHYTTAPTNLAFFDDIRMENFDEAAESGIDTIEPVTADTIVTVYALDGIEVAKGRMSDATSGLAKGVYIVKPATGKAIRIIK